MLSGAAIAPTVSTAESGVIAWWAEDPRRDHGAICSQACALLPNVTTAKPTASTAADAQFCLKVSRSRDANGDPWQITPSFYHDRAAARGWLRSLPTPRRVPDERVR